MSLQQHIDPRRFAIGAIDQTRELRAPCSDEPGDTQHLATMQLKTRMVLRAARHR